MKLKLSDIFNSIEILEKIKGQKFADGVTGFKLARNISHMNEELDHLNAAKNALLQEYGNEKGNGKIEIPASKRDEFTHKLNDILREEVEIDILTINPDKLSGYSPIELIPIMWMLDLDAK